MAAPEPLVAAAVDRGLHERLEGTVAILERRGYAVSPSRLGELCLEGPVAVGCVRDAVAASDRLTLRDGLVVSSGFAGSVAAIARRAAAHPDNAARYLPVALDFVRTLVRFSPYVLSVSIAGSLASGGFLVSDDVDLNLVVEDGHRHLAYVAVNVLGLAHAMRYRRKPVDTHSQRPVAPRFMTANLILERSQCFPLERQDPDMAYEFLASEPVYGVALWHEVVATNPELRHHFPQMEARRFPAALRDRPLLPSWCFPRSLEAPARWLGRAGWRYMQWTRRRRPEALARVAFVRRTMRPYTLFEDR